MSKVSDLMLLKEEFFKIYNRRDAIEQRSHWRKKKRHDEKPE